uniref:Uncharacterized protein n=1 Tax=Onchocerca volvulus TaxID=6282 RepID=A0A8R1TUE9_ONCVO
MRYDRIAIIGIAIKKNNDAQNGMLHEISAMIAANDYIIFGCNQWESQDIGVRYLSLVRILCRRKKSNCESTISVFTITVI